MSQCTQVLDILKPTNLETITALRNILDSSTFKAIKTLRTLDQGGVESVLPPELAPVLDGLKTAGLGGEIDNIEKKIASASKVALAESEVLLSESVKNIKFTDAAAVVLGGEDAATGVLKRVMYETVRERYSAQISEQLGDTEVEQYWPIAAGAYNLFSSNKVDGSLPDFLAERAVDVLFLTIGKREKAIRSDYKSLGDQVVNKVFDYYLKDGKA